jgi:hypothetical protein
VNIWLILFISITETALVCREDNDGVGSSAAATVFGQISQILRDGLSDVSGC